ncbi:MAG: MarR family transcriptional regulator [Hyphomicrobiaceae bacterium]
MKTPRLRTSLDASPVHLLHRAGQFAAELFADEMGEEGLTPRQYAVLKTIAENEGLSQTGLVERTGIDRSTLADVVRRMQKKGLIQRRRTKQDARAYAVKLSEAGWNALKSADPGASRVDEKLLAALPERRRQEFIDSLVIIMQAASPEEREEAA